jgi:O-antigen ligase
MSVRQKLNTKFLDWGWLLPASFPVLEVVGRAPLNIATGVYLFWGLFLLSEKKLGASKIKFAYFLVLAAFSLGVFAAVEPLQVTRSWLRYAFLALTYFLTCHALSERDGAWEKQFKSLAVAGGITAVALILRGLFTTDFQRIVPFQGMLERNLPFLFPFVLFYLGTLKNHYIKWGAGFLISGTFLVLIVYSGGRSAFVAFLIALAVYGVLALRLKLHTVIIVCVLVAVVAGSLGGGVMLRRLSLDDPLSVDIDQLSSQRTLLWRQAISNPPENQWVGVGMRNVRYSEKVIAKKGGTVKHLHNFILDTWYETGFLGLIAYFAFVGSMIWVAFKKMVAFNWALRRNLAPVIAAAAALFAGGLLSFSYYSPQLTVYLFFVLATSTVCSDQTSSATTND